MANFETAYKKTAKAEGGWNHVAGDRGGETYKGIARNSWPKWSGWVIIDEWKKKNGTPEHGQIFPDAALDARVKSFYKERFWDTIWGDQIRSQGFAEQMYDHSVNSGPEVGIKLAQRILQAFETGRMTRHLLNQINNSDETA